MVNYKVQNMGMWEFDEHSKVSGHFLYEVVEANTNQIIRSNLTQGEAKALCRHLNFGGGFDGFTPAFFLQNCEKTEQFIEELV
jgi:hypothetical protein